MAGPVFNSVGALSSSSSANTRTPAKPGVGDGGGNLGVLLAACVSKNNEAHTCSTSGWAKLYQTHSGAAFTVSLWIADESAAAPVFAWTTATPCMAQVAYFYDINAPVYNGVSVAGTVGTGTGATHTSTGFNSDAADALAVYVDAVASNTRLAAPTGWTEHADAGVSSPTSVSIVWGSKKLGASGSASGNISVAGAAAAWVQYQVELKTLAAAGLDVSKVEAALWLDPLEGLAVSKHEATLWLDTSRLECSKFEATLWLDAAPAASNRRMSLM